MKRFYLVLLVLLVIAVATGISVGVYLYYKKPASTEDLKTNAKVSIDKITADFKTDSAKARKKYNNDVVMMTGVINKIEKDQSGHIFIDFVSNNVKVQCLVQDDSKAAAEELQNNQNVQLKGKFTGYSFDEIIDPQPQLQFRDCIVVKN